MIKRWDSKADWESYFSKDAVIVITPDGKLTEGGTRHGHVIYHYDSGSSLNTWIESKISCECEPAVPPHTVLVGVTFRFAETEAGLVLASPHIYVGCNQPYEAPEFPVDLSSYTGRWISVDFRLLTTDNTKFKSYVDWLEVEHDEPTPEPAFECEDIRLFATVCKDVVQDKAIIPKKIDDGEVRKENLWDEGDDETIENLVKGETTFADNLHGHQAILDMYNEWAKRWYYKTSLYKPQDPPDESTSQAGADLVGYKVKKNTALQPSWNIDNVDEAILALTLLMKGLKERKFPTIQETMHTKGRMLNLTFVPLPDNHNSDGKWHDGTDVKESQCSWLVSPAFIWGFDFVPTPWVFSCSTFGTGYGGAYPPSMEETKWTWDKWWFFMDKIWSGNILYGRWLIFFWCIGVIGLFGQLFNIFGSHANYHIVGTHWWGEEEEASVRDHHSYRDENGNYIDGWNINQFPDTKDPDGHYDDPS